MVVLVLGIGNVNCVFIFLVLAPVALFGKSKWSFILKFISPLYDLQKKMMSFSSLR